MVEQDLMKARYGQQLSVRRIIERGHDGWPGVNRRVLFVVTLAVMRTAPWGVASGRDCLILVASGVIGIALEAGDEVVAAEVVRPERRPLNLDAFVREQDQTS